MSRRRGRGCGSSAGRLVHPPHSMRVVEACSAAAARGAAFVRSHCRPRITEVHSVAACAASAQSQSLHGTFPSCHQRRKLHGQFSYAAGDAASYAWRRFDKTAPGHAERGIPGAGKKSRNEIPFACDAIMYELYVILYYIVWAHLSGTQRPCTRIP